MQNEMLRDFYIEAEELYAEAEEALLSIEKSDNFQIHFNAVFRAFHSVKGAAGMFDLTKLQNHMHFLENLLESKQSNTTMSSDLVDYLLNAIDVAKKILNGSSVSFDYYDPDLNKNESKNTSTKQLKQKLVKKIDERIKEKQFDGHVFVVDDELDILELTKIQLEDENFKVSTFSNVNDALNSLNKVQPDVIITDISMPEMTGLELLAEVNKLLPHLPVIVVSGHITVEVCMKALSSGVSGILEKPYDSKSLINQVSIACDRYKAFKIMNRGLDLLVYQFEDFDNYLVEKGFTAKRAVFREQLKNILKQKKILIERVRK